MRWYPSWCSSPFKSWLIFRLVVVCEAVSDLDKLTFFWILKQITQEHKHDFINLNYTRFLASATSLIGPRPGGVFVLLGRLILASWKTRLSIPDVLFLFIRSWFGRLSLLLPPLSQCLGCFFVCFFSPSSLVPSTLPFSVHLLLNGWEHYLSCQ